MNNCKFTKSHTRVILKIILLLHTVKYLEVQELIHHQYQATPPTTASTDIVSHRSFLYAVPKGKGKRTCQINQNYSSNFYFILNPIKMPLAHNSNVTNVVVITSWLYAESPINSFQGMNADLPGQQSVLQDPS